MRLAAAVAAAVIAVPALAIAQPGVAPVLTSPTLTPPAEPTPDVVGIDKRQKEDPGSDRAYLARTALIAPSGTVTIQARAPIAPGAIGGISASLGRVEIGVSTLLILVDDEGGAVGFNAKVQLLKGRRSALAATLDTLSVPDEDGTLYMSSLVASFCTDGDACNTLLSAHLTMLAADGEEEAPVFAGVSFSKGARTRLVGEFHITDNEDESVFGGYLGGRWGGSKVAFDAGIGFGGVVEENECFDDYCDGSDSDVAPWPFVGLSARM